MNTTRRAAEFVLPGHPDKLSDAIADALVEEAARREQRALVGVEVAVHRGSVFVTGRIACRDAESIDVPAIARTVYASAGYGGSWYPDPDDLAVSTDLCLGPLEDGEAEFRVVSDDQCIVTGYAIDLPGTNYLPPEHWLAYRLARRLETLRVGAPELALGPDGKVIVVLDESQDTSRLASFSTSLQQAIGGPAVDLQRAVLAALREELVIAAEAIPGLRPEVPDDVRVNGAGNFAVGGPQGDNGLSGKKLVVDAYGPRVPIGGGALSGKDFYKADRAGAIIARRLAKAVVLTGVGRCCTAKVAFFPGDSEATLLSLATDEGEIPVARWERLLDLSLGGAGDAYSASCGLVEVARHGHFTRLESAWERVSFANAERLNPDRQLLALSSDDPMRDRRTICANLEI